MLVIDEDAVQHITPAISYLEQAEENLPDYLKRIEGLFPRRINKDDLISVFSKHGLFRSYTLRESIVGVLHAPRKPSVSEV